MKTTIQNTILLLLFLLGGIAAQSAEKVSRSDALRKAMELCGDRVGHARYNYYMAESYLLPDPVPGTFPLPILTWEFFVDMQPGTGWEHQCRTIHVYKDLQPGGTIGYKIIERKTPPNDKMMQSILIGDKVLAPHIAKIKPKVMKMPGGNDDSKDTTNLRTHALIISGGINPLSNNERYWNDCSFLYQTLRNRYNIPASNISAIMSDGADPAADMLLEDWSSFVSSPTDLDGDSIPDIKFSATKANIKHVLDSLKGRIGTDDHLFIFVIDHGGHDFKTGHSYICLWNDEKLYDHELAEYLKDIDTGYINIVLGQCNSGGFVEELKGGNRLVTTACGKLEQSYACPELPFDEFVYRWTCAINGKDESGKTVKLPIRKAHKFVTMRDAFEYASHEGAYTNDKHPYASETPEMSYLKKSTSEMLAFDNIMDPVYLCITSGEDQLYEYITDPGPIYYDFFSNQLIGISLHW